MMINFVGMSWSERAADFAPKDLFFFRMAAPWMDLVLSFTHYEALQWNVSTHSVVLGREEALVKLWGMSDSPFPQNSTWVHPPLPLPKELTVISQQFHRDCTVLEKPLFFLFFFSKPSPYIHLSRCITSICLGLGVGSRLCFAVWVKKKRMRLPTPRLMPDFTLLSTREWTTCTTATSAATGISSRPTALWTVVLFWKSQITVWWAFARPAKTMTRTLSMQVCLPTHKGISRGCVFRAAHELFWLLMLFFREALDGSWAAHIRPPPSTGDSEGWCVQFWHHTARNSPEEWTFLCGGHGPQPQR